MHAQVYLNKSNKISFRILYPFPHVFDFIRWATKDKDYRFPKGLKKIQPLQNIIPLQWAQKGIIIFSKIHYLESFIKVKIRLLRIQKCLLQKN